MKKQKYIQNEFQNTLQSQLVADILLVRASQPRGEVTEFLGDAQIQQYSTRTQCNHEEEPSNDRHGLEEIVFEEVVHGLVGWDGPEGIEVDVDAKEPDDQSQGSQLSLEANCHQDNQGCAHNVLQNLQGKKP
ncbi:hypothetical protein EK904_014484 [Melospiza melodia maxima]|nr:hypothetical protein EK904_014484 [Melospiza melodia maxima]